MIRRAIIALAAIVVTPSIGLAECYGTGAFQTCYDFNTGNEYNVTRYGNQTTVNGYNSSTGSSWDQTSTTYGNTTFNAGHDADGNSWSSTTQSYGGSTFTSGHDSDGNYFSSYCTAYGCF